MAPEALILRRCYPVPVTFADLRAAYPLYCADHGGDTRAEMLRYRRRNASTFRKAQADGMLKVLRSAWSAALKQITGAIDEVYAVVDGREVRVATIDQDAHPATWRWFSGDARILPSKVSELLAKADRDGYWEHPHEVCLELSPRPVTHEEVARAVLVGQEYAERHARG